MSKACSFDIKTANILLGQSFQAKLADVGLAQALIKQTHLSLESLRGTALPRYLLGRCSTGQCLSCSSGSDAQTRHACGHCCSSSRWKHMQLLADILE